MSPDRLNAQSNHYRFPLYSMRPNSTTEFAVRNQMSKFMWYRLANKFISIFLQQVAIKTDFVFRVVCLAGCLPPQVKRNLWINRNTK